jgi:hypothetical protein
VLTSYRDGQGFSETVTTAAGEIPFVNDGQASFSITGTRAVGEKLTIAVATADPDGNGTFSHSWQASADGSTWSGVGTGIELTIAQALEGQQLRVLTSYRDGQGFSETVTTAAGEIPFVNDGQASFSITGTRAVGEKLTIAVATADPDGNGTFSHSWQASADGSTWSGVGTGIELTIAQALEGQQLRVLTSYRDGQGFSETVTTAAGEIPFVNDGQASFSITGTRAVGEKLTIAVATADPDGNGTFSHSWQASADGSTWSGVGTGIELTIAQALEGQQLRVLTSYRDGQGFSETVTTAAGAVAVVTIAPATTTAAITAVNDNVGLIQGVVAAGARTDDRTPTITGTISAALAAGESLRIFNGSSLLGSATVNNSALTWSYTTPTLPSTGGTSYSISARVADAAGNLGTASAVRGFTLDTVAPLPQIDRIGRSVSSGFRVTAARKARTIRGSGADANADVQIFQGRRPLLTTRADGDGVFSHTFSSTEIERIGQGRKSFFARQEDAAGNRGDSEVVRAVVNTTRGTAQRDELTGVGDQRDVFRWNRLDHSLLRRYDTITNFEADDRIRIGSTRYRATVKNSSGVVNRLNAKQINKALDRRQFAADSVAAFRQRGVSGTFLVINDDRAGFQAGSDAVIRLVGFNVNHSSASIAVV